MKNLLTSLIQLFFKLLPDDLAFEQILLIVAGKLITPKLRDSIFSLVEVMMTHESDGEQKKKMIKNSLLALQDEVGESARATASWVLDTVIQQAFLVLATRSEKPKVITYVD